MEAVVASVGEKAGELAFDLIKREITYILNYKTNVENLWDGMDDLKHARQRVQCSVDMARRKREEIFEDVEKWLRKVDEKISEVAAVKVKEEEETAKARSFIRICPDFSSRYQLSKKAEKEAEAIAELLEKGRFQSVSYQRFRPVKGYYKAIESRTVTLFQVMEALRNDNSNIVGVHGMGGFGLTKLVKEVGRFAKEEQLFDEVVFAAVTQTPNIEIIQDQIAESLGMKSEETSLDVRRALICDRLKKTEKKVLVILDDIWEILDLGALGIPSRGDLNKGCKILLASPRFNVLSSMGILKPFSISILRREAWDCLFWNMAGAVLPRSDLYSATIEVAQNCAALPVAIATAANALKIKETLFEWKKALQELKRSSLRNFNRKPGDECTTEVPNGCIWMNSGKINLLLGSIQILIDLSSRSFRVRITSGSGYLKSDLFPVRVTFESGLFQVWAIPNSDHLEFKTFCARLKPF